MTKPVYQYTDEDPIRDLLPDNGWLGQYVRYTDPLQACARFRFFTACCMMGAAINNKVWVHRGDPGLLPKLFPNPWILLLAPPGRGNKTSTINMGVNCLHQACPGVRMLADKITPEAIVRTLSIPQGKEVVRIGPRDATGLIKAPEFSVFFGRQQYNTGLVSLITDLYDYREEYVNETIMRGKVTLRHNCLSIAGGSTADWLQSMLPEDAFKGGFMSRFILVEMPPNYLKLVPLPRKLPGTGWDQLVEGLSTVGEMQGEMDWPEKCQKEYEEIYLAQRPIGDPQVDAYASREMEQVLKIAMLLALSEEKMSFGEDKLEEARAILKALMKETEPRIERLTTHPRMKLCQDIQDLLKVYGALRQRQLLRKVYRSLPLGEAQFSEAIRVLYLTGVIRKDSGKDPANPMITLNKDYKDDSKLAGGPGKEARSSPNGRMRKKEDS